MNTILIISQICFNVSATVVIIVFGIVCCILVMHLNKIAAELEVLSKKIYHTSTELTEHITTILGQLSRLPFLSFLFRKRTKRIP